MPFDVRSMVTPVTTALLTNEVQPGTVGGGEGLGAAGARVLPNIVRLAVAGRGAGVQVVHCVKVFRRDALARNRNVVLYRLRGQVPSAPLAPDSRPVEGSVVAPELGPDDRDLVMTRLHGMGAACDTGVVPVLRNLGIRTVVVTGVSLNIGVPNTVMDLVNQGFDVVVPRDAVAGTPDDYGEMMIAHTLRFLATMTTTDDLVEAWSAASDQADTAASPR
jgi:nicotinamidase-related amidase